MAPLRRYIQLTAHTTIQALIFLEDPSVLHTWLIHPTDPALPRIVAALKDLILPKLREERERELAAMGTSKKAKAVKDVVSGRDFQVSVFFKGGATGHSLVMRRREMLATKPEEGRLMSTGSKMVQEAGTGAIDHVGDLDSGVGGGDNGVSGGDQDDGSGLRNLRIENEEVDIDLNTLPLAELPGEQSFVFAAPAPTRRSGRRTGVCATAGDNLGSESQQPLGDEDRAERQATAPIRQAPRTRTRTGTAHATRGRGRKHADAGSEPIMVDSGSESESESGIGAASSGQRPGEETKKPLFKTSYEAHTIYGKVLYLIVKKIDVAQDTVPMDNGPGTLVTRDVPIAGIEETGGTEDVMEGWMYMSQVIREDLDL